MRCQYSKETQILSYRYGDAIWFWYDLGFKK